jgi:hypothetical protein
VWGRTETNKKCLEEKQRRLERVLLGFEKFEVWSLKECVKERGIVEWGKRKTGKWVKWKSLTREREKHSSNSK